MHHDMIFLHSFVHHYYPVCCLKTCIKPITFNVQSVDLYPTVKGRVGLDKNKNKKKSFSSTSLFHLDWLK